MGDPDANSELVSDVEKLRKQPVVNSRAGVSSDPTPLKQSAVVNEMTCPHQIPEHWLNRLRVVLWGQHQVLIAWMLLAMLVFMALFFSARWVYRGPLVDFDAATPLTATFKVDLNTADVGELILLPGVGRKLAVAIIDRREFSGGFESVDELGDVPGIGAKTVESLRPYLLPIQIRPPNR